MTKIIIKFSMLFVFASLAFSGCFSPWKGDDAVLTLFLGNGPGGRAAIPDGVVHTVNLDGPTGGQSHTAEGAKQFSVRLRPGYWRVSIEASLEGEPFAHGEGGAEIKAGRNNHVEINMILADREAGITIKFLLDEKAGLVIDPKFDNQEIVISGIDNKDLEPAFTAEVDGEFDYIEWLIWGLPIGKGKKITIEAKDYNPGTYRLTVRVEKNKTPYSTEITFTVMEGD